MSKLLWKKLEVTDMDINFYYWMCFRMNIYWPNLAELQNSQCSVEFVTLKINWQAFGQEHAYTD